MKTFLFFLLLLIFNEIGAQQWVGTVNTDWNTPGNWNPATVPTTGSIVTFNIATPPFNCVLNTAVTITQFSQSNGVFSMAAGGSLTVSNTFTISGGTFNAGSGIVSVPGSTFTLSGGTLDAGSATFNIGGNMIINSPPSVIPGTATVIFNGSVQQDVLAISDAAPGTIVFYNLVINKPGGSIIRFSSTSSIDTFQVNNLLTLTDGQFLGNGFIKIEKDLLSQPGFDGSGIPIACTGPNPGTVTLQAPLAVTGVSNFVGIAKSSPSTTVSVYRSGGGDDTIRIGNFNARFIVREGIIQFPDNPPIISTFNSLEIEPGGTFKSTSNYFFNAGQHINSGGTFDANNGTYVFFHSPIPAVTNLTTSNVENFYKLIIDMPGGQFNPGTNDTLVVNDSLILKGGLITGSSGSALNAKGNFVFKTSMDPTQTNTKLIFSGTTDQHIIFESGVSDRWNASITLNKPSGNLILNSPWTLDETSQVFTFTKGIVTIPDTTNNYIYFTNAYSVAGASAASYVDGPVRVKRWTNDPFEFPIGNAGFYAPIRVSDFWGSSEDVIFSAQYFHQPSEFSTQTTIDPPIVNISQREWWRIKRVIGTVSLPPYLWLSFDNLRSGGVTDPSKLRVTKWDIAVNRWLDRGNGEIVANFIRSTQPIAEFSPFTLASTDPVANPLPVRLVSFTATPKDFYNLLKWAVTNEENFDKYIIESSIDGLLFNTIGSIKGLGNVQEQHYEFHDTTLSLKTYYRLKMLDIDGKFTYSPVVIVNRPNQHFAVRILPNPGNGTFNMNIISEFASPADMMVSDLSGKMLYKNFFHIQKGINSYNYSIPILTNGIYFINIKTEKGERQVLRYVVMK